MTVSSWPSCACGHALTDPWPIIVGVRRPCRACPRDDYALPWRVGDVVQVGRACLGHPPNTRALVVELYDRQRLFGGAELGVGTTLLFPDGAVDGFSPMDRDLFWVARVGHVAAIADYVYTSSVRLLLDYHDGRFAAAFA